MVKIKILFKIGLLLFVCFMLSGCPDDEVDDVSFRIENNSGSSIVWSFYIEGRTIDYYQRNWWGNKYEKYTILQDSFTIREHRSGTLKTLLKRGAYRYYFFDLDSLQTIPWERIRDERIILKEVVFTTWEEMEASNFTITYP
jgi:hypothetical protein